MPSSDREPFLVFPTLWGNPLQQRKGCEGDSEHPGATCVHVCRVQQSAGACDQSFVLKGGIPRTQHSWVPVPVRSCMPRGPGTWQSRAPGLLQTESHLCSGVQPSFGLQRDMSPMPTVISSQGRISRGGGAHRNCLSCTKTFCRQILPPSLRLPPTSTSTT